jgi:uncharacterized protein YndB with AHSA1/START domain
MIIRRSVTIGKPAAEVWSYLTDPAKVEQWQVSAVEIRKETEGPMRVGSKLMDVRRFLGKRMELEMEVTEFEPERRFSLRVASGPFPFESRQTLTAADGATTVDVTLEGEPGGFFKLAAPLVQHRAERQLETDLETLKDLLESEPA